MHVAHVGPYWNSLGRCPLLPAELLDDGALLGGEGVFWVGIVAALGVLYGLRDPRAHEDHRKISAVLVVYGDAMLRLRPRPVLLSADRFSDTRPVDASFAEEVGAGSFVDGAEHCQLMDGVEVGGDGGEDVGIEGHGISCERKKN